MKAPAAFVCAAILVTGCHANNEMASTSGILLKRVVAMDGETMYPDPLSLDAGSGGKAPMNLKDAAAVLSEMIPLTFTDSGKEQAARACEFASSEQWSSDFRKCGEVVCSMLPSRSQDLGCGYLVRTIDWVEENWLGGLCRIAESKRNESPLFRWFVEHNVTECFQMSEVIAAGSYRTAAGLPVDEKSYLRR